MALFLISSWVVLLDQISKAVIMRRLDLYEVVPCLGGFVRITHVRNAGAAFGMLQNKQNLFTAATLLAAALVLVFHQRIPKREWPVRTGLALGLGGAVGNLIDRIRFSSVVDFVEISPWPIFNLADSAIVLGVALILLWILRVPGRKEE
ncbi:MAG: signal peptidase II [Clostridia bacterium]|nr:signal peptidase II [Clostridia bacterium]